MSPFTCTFLLILVISTQLNGIQAGANVEKEIKNVLHEFIGDFKGPIDVDDNTEIRLFCRRGDPKILDNYFRSASLRITSTAEDLYILRGSSPQEVYYRYKHTTKFLLWAGNLLPWRVRDTSFTTFNSSCIGISTTKPYRAELVIRQIDPFGFLLFIAGGLLFYFSPRLSQSVLFFYGSGTILGAIGAFLLILFIVYRFLPRGKTGIFSISILSSLFLYLAGELYNKFEQLCKENLGSILVYLTIGAAFSFAVCYRFGPPTNPRTIDMIRWALMGMGLLLIHLSSDLIEISTTIIILILFFYNFYEAIYFKARKIWLKFFPPAAKLLTEEEYITQGAIETEKSLAELRSFCASPNCNSWKVISRLKDPKRFSDFMNGSSHLQDDEMMEYQRETFSDEEDGDVGQTEENELLTDDSDDEIELNNGGVNHNHSLVTDDSD